MTKATFEGVTYELREGTSGNDRLIEGLGKDWIKGGAGNDTILDVLGDNLFDGGAGSDTVTGGIGNDRFIHRLAENVGSSDRYEGGLDTDTLRLELTAAEWARADVQADIAGFLAHVATTKNKLLGLVGLTSDYKFTSTNLTVSNIEKLEIRVDGVMLDPTDQKVTAVGETLTVNSTAAASINLLGNDTVPDRVATISFATLPGSSYGSIAFAPSLGGTTQTANLTFTPGAGYTALKADEVKTESFTYTIKDVDGDTATATAIIKIVGVNDGPVAVADSVTTNEDTSVTIDVLANDTDPDADALTIVSATGPNGKGWLSVIDNKLVFDPGQDFQALSSGQSEAVELTYTVKDALGAQSTAKVMVSIIGLADAPAPDVIGDGTDSLGVIYGKGGATTITMPAGGGFATGDGIQKTDFLDIYNLNEAWFGNDTITGSESTDGFFGEARYLVIDSDDAGTHVIGNDFIELAGAYDEIYSDFWILNINNVAPDLKIIFGNDYCDGGDGNDYIRGDAWTANVNGPINVNQFVLGDDIVIGGAGDDWMSGDIEEINGAYASQFRSTATFGADRFVFSVGSGRDIIWDFGRGNDKLDVSGYGYTNFSQINFSVSGPDTIVDLDGDPNVNTASITLKSYSGLSAADFIFA